MTEIPNHAPITRAFQRQAITNPPSNHATPGIVLSTPITHQSRESRAGAITPGGGTKYPPGVLRASETALIAALSALRNAGLVVAREDLNRGWSELTGRSQPAAAPEPTRCQHPGCTAPGRPFHEPLGIWCLPHVPTLWRVPESRWATPRCHTCGAPGAWPARAAMARPSCRNHAPRSITRYLHHDHEQESA